jgi:hypothetical protein
MTADGHKLEYVGISTGVRVAEKDPSSQICVGLGRFYSSLLRYYNTSVAGNL